MQDYREFDTASAFIEGPQQLDLFGGEYPKIELRELSTHHVDKFAPRATGQFDWAHRPLHRSQGQMHLGF